MSARLLTAIACVSLALFTGTIIAGGQQAPEWAKLAPIFQQQRNLEADGRAQCAVVVIELQARVAELEKQLAAAQAHKDE